MEISDMELDPMVAALALGGGILSTIVLSGTKPSILMTITAFIGTTILTYFVVSYIKNK